MSCSLMNTLCKAFVSETCTHFSYMIHRFRYRQAVDAKKTEREAHPKRPVKKADTAILAENLFAIVPAMASEKLFQVSCGVKR